MVNVNMTLSGPRVLNVELCLSETSEFSVKAGESDVFIFSILNVILINIYLLSSWLWPTLG